MTELFNANSTLQVRSLVKPEGVLEVSLVRIPLPELADDEIVVRVEATPINPSDLGVLFGGADLSTLSVHGSGDETVLSAKLPPGAQRAMAPRAGVSMPVGNEGAGTVVAAGGGAKAQALLGKTVAMLGGAMYARHRRTKVSEVMALPEGVTPRDGASAFVNPLTALGMVETMRTDGHTGLIHTAAASNLGQMLVKLCLADKVPLVNIVRSPAQVELLRGVGAQYICDSSAPDFVESLIEALGQTGATLAFDAIGGGRLVSQILSAMEAAAIRRGEPVTAYGTTIFKQAYIYGGLDMAPTELVRSFGLNWRLGGWLLTNFVQRTPPERLQALRARVAAELKGVFASSYSDEISLLDLLQPETVRAYAKRATGQKYLLNPNR